MFDRTDRLIIEELFKNSRITMKELGRKVHLTGQAVADRVAKLEDRGVIESYTIKVNQELLGYPVHVLLTIQMTGGNHRPYLSFLEQQQEYVLHNYKVSGHGCYQLECRFPSNEELDQFLTALGRHANYALSIVIKS
ncbi:Lrp/AsnC family transcriptional regulator [Edaphobacillus lindanitolerans]|uniref:Transcriptional regulator, AsnC family n=1 Tax=Edaphobacillus lindanitolerans TaxID=550447 RepID=A0A1U7PQJ7_9BACI|nr:Lrp/AsnC family transcriptional regulator [Edaphobacillus lindanitolerans]SIT90839.1 transcriptional regulator, AsnC family [Edaphobacillus lindanitolerans]